MKLEIIVAHLSSSSVLLPLALSALQQKKLSRDLRFLELVLIISLLSDAVSLLFLQYDFHTHVVGNIYLLAQFSILFFILSEKLGNQFLTKSLYIVFVLFFLINITLFQGPFIFNSVSNV